MKEHRKIVRRLLIALAVIAVLAGCGYALRKTGVFERINSVDELREVISGAGAWAGVVYFFLQMMTVIVAPIPSNISMMAGALALGFWKAMILGVLAVVAGSMIVFLAARALGPEEMYLQGASSSLPEDVQNAFYRSIKGFENIEIMRPAYAIEYDCVDPTSLEATLESKNVRGLYGAGQFNGTSGYEEAAAQGLLAGLNAARNALGKEQLILPRHTSYLGTLVDDLVTKGVMDPYRMMTSRSEYRLTLRQDNADTRLTPIGREYGLVQDDRWAKYQHTQNILESERRRLHDAHLRTADLQAAMTAAGLAPAAEGGIAEELLRRPEIHYDLVAGVIGWGEGITPMLAERLETEIKYAGYIARQDRMIREVARHEKTLIPEDFEYADLTGLTLEAREKLARIRPKNLGQASRIPGVSPSDVAQLSIALAAHT